MERRHGWRIPAALLLLSLVFGAQGVVAAPGLEGRWILAGQSRGAQRGQLAAPDAPFSLEIVRRGAGLAGLVRPAGPSQAALAWPAAPAGMGPGAITIHEMEIDGARGTVRARYTLRPSSGSSRRMEITESYVLSADGRTLEGTATVTAVEEDGPAGSYVLHRLFERLP